jgi:hypothetical protein
MPLAGTLAGIPLGSVVKNLNTFLLVGELRHFFARLPVRSNLCVSKLTFFPIGKADLVRVAGHHLRGIVGQRRTETFSDTEKNGPFPSESTFPIWV